MKVWVVFDAVENEVRAICDNAETALSIAIQLEREIYDGDEDIIEELQTRYVKNPDAFFASTFWSIYSTELNQPIK